MVKAKSGKELNKVEEIKHKGRDFMPDTSIESLQNESEELLQLYINSTSDIVFTLDTEQRHTGVYGDWVKKTGMSKLDFLGKTAFEIFGSVSVLHKMPIVKLCLGKK